MNHRRRQQLQTIKAHEILIIGLFSVAELNTLLELLGEIGIRLIFCESKKVLVQSSVLKR